MIEITSDNLGIFFNDGGQLHISISSVLCGLILLQVAALAFAGWYISKQREEYRKLKIDEANAIRDMQRAEEKSVELQSADHARLLGTTSYYLADGPFKGNRFTLDNRINVISLMLDEQPYRRIVCQYSVAERNSLNPNESYTKPTMTLDCICEEVLRVAAEDLEDEED